MCPSDLQAITLRSLHFEACEVRLVLSGQPASEVAIQSSADSEDPLVLADIHHTTGVAYAHDHLGLTGFGQTVAVIDSGVAYDHAALGGGFGRSYRVVGGWDFAEDDADPFDDAPAGLHGTHIAGIIGSQHTEHLGVAPEVDLVALRVFDDQGGSDFEWVESALQWVYDNRNQFEHPITTVNLSLGATWSGSDLPEWATLEDEFARLRRSGIFVSVAAGNSFEAESAAGLNYPAASPHVVPVASYGADDEISAFSRRGDRVLVAPGEGITSTATDFIYDFNGITDDYYSASGTSMAAAYVSGVSVLLRQAMQAAGTQNISHDSIYQLLHSTANTVYDPATTSHYRHIDVRAALDRIAPTFDDLGTIATQQISQLAASESGLWYRVGAGRSGILTLETLNDDKSDIHIEVFDADRQPIPNDSPHAPTNRVDLNVRQNQSLLIRLSGQNADVDVRMTNLLSSTSYAVDVFGTQANDRFQLELTADRSLSVNGVTYALSESAATIRIHGGAGDDTLRINGTADDETVWLDETSARVRGPDYLIQSDATERNSVYSGGGHDRVYLFDSRSDDTFFGLADYSLLMGPSFRSYAHGFADVRAYSVSGGQDIARLYDSTGNDQLSSLPTYSLLVGDDFRNYAKGFEAVRAYARNGGRDEARLFGSTLDDHLYALPSYSLMTGVGFDNYAEGFERVRAYANQGGHDEARLFDSSDDDAFYGLPNYSVMMGPGFDNYAQGFERVRAYSHRGGRDEARLFDSAGDDVFYGLPEYALLKGNGFDNYVESFDRVRSYAYQGGHDEARLYDSREDDTFYGLPEYSVLTGPGFNNYVANFDVVRAYGNRGGHDEAQLIDSSGDDLYSGRPGQGMLKGDRFVNYAFAFDIVRVRAERGGHDRAELRGAPTDDLFTSRASLNSLLGVDYYHEVHDFEVSNAYAGSGGQDRAIFSELSAHDAVYRQVNSTSGLDVIDATVHDFPVIDVHQGGHILRAAGYLAVDYLLRDGETWL